MRASCKEKPDRWVVILCRSCCIKSKEAFIVTTEGGVAAQGSTVINIENLDPLRTWDL